MNDFLIFRKMITPIIIQIIFWIGLVAIVLTGITGIAAGIDMPGEGGYTVLAGFAILLLGPLFLRVYCELLILFFRMNDTLTEIKNNTLAPHE